MRSDLTDEIIDAIIQNEGRHVERPRQARGFAPPWQPGAPAPTPVLTPGWRRGEPAPMPGAAPAAPGR